MNTVCQLGTPAILVPEIPIQDLCYAHWTTCARASALCCKGRQKGIIGYLVCEQHRKSGYTICWTFTSESSSRGTFHPFHLLTPTAILTGVSLPGCSLLVWRVCCLCLALFFCWFGCFVSVRETPSHCSSQSRHFLHQATGSKFLTDVWAPLLR